MEEIPILPIEKDKKPKFKDIFITKPENNIYNKDHIKLIINTYKQNKVGRDKLFKMLKNQGVTRKEIDHTLEAMNVNKGYRNKSQKDKDVEMKIKTITGEKMLFAVYNGIYFALPVEKSLSSAFKKVEELLGKDISMSVMKNKDQNHVDKFIIDFSKMVHKYGDGWLDELPMLLKLYNSKK